MVQVAVIGNGKGFFVILRKYAVLLLVMSLVWFSPALARAVPVEPSVELVQKDRDSGRFTTVSSTTAKYKTQFQAVQTATVRAPYETPSRAGNRPDVRKLLTTAKSFLGQPYVYGAAGPYGFDCSGFTLYVFKKVGINLPHLASAQAKYGTRVDKSELKPGDLLFFGYHGSSTIEHVGIYVGNGNFIHASSHKGVVITPLSSSYYAQNYKGASRLLPG